MAKQIILYFLLLQIIISLFSCANRWQYKRAIKDARMPTCEKVYNQLNAINSSNTNLIWKDTCGKKYVLVVAWKGDKKFFGNDSITGYYTTDRSIFITAVPYLKKYLQLHPTKNPKRRFLQILGLPPTSKYNYFVEFWVRPEDLIRPCIDKETDDTSCECFKFSINYPSGHIKWLNEKFKDSYSRKGLYKKYPFTALGYTYDWHRKNKNHVGLSEFVIMEKAKTYVKKIYTNCEYFNYILQ